MPQSSPSDLKTAANRWLAGLTMAIGAVSLLAFGLFLVTGPLVRPRIPLPWPVALAMDAGLSLVFFLIHSGLVRTGVRKYLSLLMADRFHGVLYTLTSAAALLLLVLCWQPVPPVLVVFPAAVRWLLHGLLVAGMAGFAWTALTLKRFDAFGVDPLIRPTAPEPAAPGPLTMTGPFGWVRHPFYFFSIVLMWSYPDWTPDRLVFNLLWTAWVWIGAVLEERDLVARFGDAYRRYQKQVPRLVPRWRGHSRTGQ